MSTGDGDTLVLGAEAQLDITPFLRRIDQLESRVAGMTQKLAKESTAQANTLANVSQAFTQMGAQVSALGQHVSRGGRAILGGMGQWIDAAGTFESGLDALKIVANADAAELENLRQVAIQTGIDTAFSPREATQAMFELKSAGLETTDAIAAMPAVLDLVAASAGEIDLSSGAVIGTVAMNKFGLTTSQIPGFMDQIVRVNQISNFHFREMLTFMNSLGPTAALMSKTTVASLLAIGGAARNAGMSAAQAGAAVGAVGRSMTFLQKELSRKGGRRKRRLAALQLFGLTPEELKTSKGEWKDMAEILALVMKGSEGMEEAQRNASLQTLFGASNALGLGIAMSKLKRFQDPVTGQWVEGTDALLAMSKELEAQAGGTGLAREAAESFLDTWAGIKKLFEGSIETFQIVMGSTLLPLLKPIVKTTLMLFNIFLGWVRSSLVLRVALLAVGVVLGTILLLSGTLLVTVGGLLVAFAGLAMTYSAVSAAGFTLTGVMVMLETVLWPLLLVTLAIVAAMALLGVMFVAAVAPFALQAAVLYTVWTTNFGGIRDFVLDVVDTLTTAWGVLTTFLGGGAIDEDTFNKMGEHSNLMSLISTIVMLRYRFGELTKGIRRGMEPSMGALGRALPKVSDAFNKLFTALGKLFGFDVPEMTLGDPQTWGDVGEAIGSAVGFLIDALVILIDNFATVVAWLAKHETAVKIVAGVFLFLGIVVAAAALALVTLIGLVLLPFILVLAAIMFSVIALIAAFVTLGMIVPAIVIHVAEAMREAGVRLIDNLWAGMQEKWGELKTWFTGGLASLADMLPGSEPNDPSSPLANLSVRGAAMLTNFGAGLLMAVPLLGAQLGDALVGATTGTPFAVMAEATGTTEGPSVADAAVGAVGGSSVSVSIGQIVVSATGGETAEDLAKKIGELIKEEVELALSSNMG